jgi:ubiquinone/menaquinone biosynthesis C-methylase UbiE
MGKKPSINDFIDENAVKYENKKQLYKLQRETGLIAIKILKERRPKIDEERILDLGCGTGWTMMTLLDHDFKNVVGLDFSNDMLKFAIKRGLNVIKSNIKKPLPFKNNIFGGIISISTINFIEEDCLSYEEISDAYYQIANEIYRLLKKDGIAIIQYFKKKGAIEENIMINIFKKFCFNGGTYIIDEGLRKEIRFLVLEKI